MKELTKKALLEELKEGNPDIINEINEFIFEHSPFKHNPVGNVKWVKLDEVQANDYNPNVVASQEMKLLAISIRHDGFTQPCVCMKDEKTGKFCIVDGFHRYYVNKTYKEIMEGNKGRIPIVVINKPINDRMASTVRHNRARGKHTVQGMGQLIFKMIDNGWDDAQICNELGLEPDELIRLKHVSGVAKLFAKSEYKNAWEESYQVAKRIKAAKEEKDEQ
jgi:hypothetical protein